VQDFKRNADLYWARFCHIIGGSILIHEVHGYYRLHGSNMFSVNTVFGDDYINGIDPPSVVEAARKTMLDRFIRDKTLVSILKAHQIVAIALNLAQTRQERLAIVKASILDAKTSRKVKKKLRRQAIKSFFRKPFAVIRNN